MPTSSGIVTVFDATTGQPALVLLDDGYLTDLRTAATGALANGALARKDITAVTMIGTGGQARHQLTALLEVRQPRRLVIYGHTAAHAAALAAWAHRLYPWEIIIADTIPDSLSGADLVITVTPSDTPLIHTDWLPEGVHVTAVGADGPHKRELHRTVLTRANRIAVDDLAQARSFGELKDLSDDAAAALPVVTLGALLSGDAPGRGSDTDITIADLTGLGAQDAALAGYIARHALS
ncbi:ornithine cyclodeaminase family protein [Micromonospora sp. WMMA1363]|uniref:ornithine cyclodeaminase family protein n=1 Tax=Micromonospora sp. WMMA1363 TaxID=3053985 RepID=UPI00259C8981|nr:ornithine cyclodeaminase family protein [Micromonospora sp. WMMA1363]MDM4719687.1 ornithine cyclodeaminase family protein [Micromonospora sp. WMMA1363]